VTNLVKVKRILNTVIPIVAMIMCCAIVVLVYVRLKGQSQQKPLESYIYLLIPLSEPISFNTDNIVNSFQGQWGYQISCELISDSSVSDQASSQYLMSNGKQNLTVSINNLPLPQSSIEMLTNPIFGLRDDEKLELRNHKANISIQYAYGDKNPNERVIFTGQVLLTLLNLDNAIGYLNVAAQSYRSKGQLINRNILGKKVLQLEDLYLMFVSTQQVDYGTSYWLHTHGLEQFNLPNLEITFQDRDKLGYYQMVLDNMAIYIMENGNIFKSGDTAEIMGDGVNYLITVRKDEEFPTDIVTISRQ